MVACNLLNDQELMVLSDELRERICDAVRQRYEIEWATDVQSFHWLRRYAGLDEPSVQKPVTTHGSKTGNAGIRAAACQDAL